MRRVISLTAAIGAPLCALPALAAQPEPGALGLQPPVTEVADRVASFHNGLLLPIITAISLFVLALLIVIIVRFNRRANPEPSRTTHNTLLEIVWTLVPILILVVIAFPSLSLLEREDTVPDDVALTIKATGHQWSWTYDYPDHGGFFIDSSMVKDADLKPGQPRLLSTDTHVMVPVGKTVRMQVTADDVIHSWAMPSFGVKVDAVPGRLNEIWFNVREEGLYYGQCSELCGRDHGFMPIVVEVVSQEKFDAWVAGMRAEFGLAQAGGAVRTATLH